MFPRSSVGVTSYKVTDYSNDIKLRSKVTHYTKNIGNHTALLDYRNARSCVTQAVFALKLWSV